MIEIELTKALKDYGAIVVIDDDMPDGFIPIAGFSAAGANVRVCIPVSLMGKKSIVNMLANQAQDCLIDWVQKIQRGNLRK